VVRAYIHLSKTCNKIIHALCTTTVLISAASVMLEYSLSQTADRPTYTYIPSDSSTLYSSLLAPFVRTSFTARSFSVAAPKIRNSLPYLSVLVLIPSVVTSTPTTASRPSNPLNPSPHTPQIRLLLTIVCVYKLYLLTYILISGCVIQCAVRRKLTKTTFG